jgi:hypothetical protein
VRKAVAVRWLLAGISVTVLFSSGWHLRSILARGAWFAAFLGAFGVLFGLLLEVMEKRKERPIYLKPLARPRPLDLTSVRRSNTMILVVAAAATLSFGLAACFIKLPVPWAISCFAAGTLFVHTLRLLLPLESDEEFVTNHNDWLRRMSPSPDHLDDG